MRSTRLLFILILIIIFHSFAQEIQNNHLIVYGKVKVFAKADRASVIFLIKGVGSSLKSAFDDARNQMRIISNELYGLGLSKKNISTSFFQSSENFGDKAFLSSKKDYRSIMTVTITTDSLSLLEPIVIILSESEVERIVDISFDLTNYSEMRKKGLEKAVFKAKEKAELISKEFDIKIGNILTIEESETQEPLSRSYHRFGNYPSPFNAPLYFSRQSTFSPGEDSSIYSEEISFFSEVKVVFEILNIIDNELDVQPINNSKN